VSELSVAVVGLGFGANHARILGEMEGVRLAAVCDTDAARLAAAHAGAKRYKDYAAMLRDEDLDAVVLAVPARLHEKMGIAAIEAGRALLVEKPLAPSLEEARRLADSAERAGVMLMTGHIERFNPALQALRCRLQDGDIGRPLHLSARRMAPIVRRPMQDVNVVHDSALHDIDVMRWLLGAEVERISAEAQSGVIMPFEDSIAATLRFDSGVVGSMEVNWLSAQRLRDFTAMGDKGVLHAIYTDFRAPTLTLYRDGKAEEIYVEPLEPLKQELSAFLTAVRNQEPSPVSSADAMAAVAIADAITESARSGRSVTPQRP
jgi:UDP-N-acetylglucosamine 3-dehydrogenase